MPLRDRKANELLLVKGFYEARHAHPRQTSFTGLTSSCKTSVAEKGGPSSVAGQGVSLPLSSPVL